MLSHFYPVLMLHAPALGPRGHTSFISAPKEFYDHVLELKKYSWTIGVACGDLCVPTRQEWVCQGRQARLSIPTHKWCSDCWWSWWWKGSKCVNELCSWLPWVDRKQEFSPSGQAGAWILDSLMWMLMKSMRVSWIVGERLKVNVCNQGLRTSWFSTLQCHLGSSFPCWLFYNLIQSKLRIYRLPLSPACWLKNPG